MKKWGTPKNFFLTFMMSLKNNYLLKKLFKWINQKQNNFNIYNVAFKNKIKKNACRYDTGIYPGTLTNVCFVEEDSVL